MKILNFEDLEVWKEARKLTQDVYVLTRNKIFAKDYGLKDQIQRAAVSCMSNAAEEFDSDTNLQFITFLGYSKRSASEVQSILYVALDCHYITENEFVKVYEQSKTVRKLCAGFIRYLRNITSLKVKK